MEKVLKIDILDVVSCSDTKIIKVSGELVMSNSNNFKVTAEGLVEKGIVYLIIDLSNLIFIDSIGTLNLINIHIKTRRRGGNMCLFGVNNNIKEVFDTVGLAKLVSLYNDMSEAITAIKKKKIG
ncbi:MAG: STAS domain-containing protein [Elusimicrobia bacterium]|nr:STAS domain-containing protein [Elusimicrobiota bacterium]